MSDDVRYVEVDGVRYKMERGIPIPETRGRKRLDEDLVVQIFLECRSKGLFKNYSYAARQLSFLADKHSGGEETKFHRLRRKFSKAWKEYNS